MPQPLPQRGHSCQTEDFAKTIQTEPLACIIDGRDIICQEKYRKFLQEGCRVVYEDRGKATGTRDLRLAYGLSDLWESVAAAPSISLRETNQSGCCSHSSSLAVLGIWKPAIVRGICRRLQFRWLKRQLQIKYDV